MNHDTYATSTHVKSPNDTNTRGANTLNDLKNAKNENYYLLDSEHFLPSLTVIGL